MEKKLLFILWSSFCGLFRCSESMFHILNISQSYGFEKNLSSKKQKDAQKSISLDSREKKDLFLRPYDQYFNEITSLQSDFQEESRHKKNYGRFYLKRPGQMRFSYHPKGRVELVTDGDHLVFHEKETGTLNYSVLKNTPLYFLLKPTVSIQDHFNLKTVRTSGPLNFLTFTSKKDPLMGSVTLVFQKKPLELLQWILKNDRQGGMTITVSLSNLKKNIAIPDQTFNLKFKN